VLSEDYTGSQVLVVDDPDSTQPPVYFHPPDVYYIQKGKVAYIKYEALKNSTANGSKYVFGKSKDQK